MSYPLSILSISRHLPSFSPLGMAARYSSARSYRCFRFFCLAPDQPDGLFLGRFPYVRLVLVGNVGVAPKV